MGQGRPKQWSPGHPNIRGWGGTTAAPGTKREPPAAKESHEGGAAVQKSLGAWLRATVLLFSLLVCPTQLLFCPLCRAAAMVSIPGHNAPLLPLLLLVPHGFASQLPWLPTLDQQEKLAWFWEGSFGFWGPRRNSLASQPSWLSLQGGESFR